MQVFPASQGGSWSKAMQYEIYAILAYALWEILLYTHHMTKCDNASISVSGLFCNQYWEIGLCEGLEDISPEGFMQPDCVICNM
jgi:ABC-type multidrug transport system permease subunit